MKPKVIDPKETTRLEAFELWMNAPNPMVTFFKQIVELIRLQKHYEACMDEINTLEASKKFCTGYGFSYMWVMWVRFYSWFRICSNRSSSYYLICICAGYFRISAVGGILFSL